MLHARPIGSVFIATLLSIAICACDKPSSAPTPTPTPAPTPTAPTVPAVPAAPEGVKNDEVKISKELWPNGKLKYKYEMRRNLEGKWARNGPSSAYFDHGVLEREGPYQNNIRVGEWKYYDDKGTLLRTEQRGEGQTEG